MKKYLFIFKSEIMSNLQYVFNIITGFIGYFLLLFVFFNLWRYMYSDPSQVINGYTMNQMIWYVVITEIIWGAVGGSRLCKDISADIKAGNIAYNLNKPYNYIGYALSRHLGAAAIKSVIYIILGITTGYVLLGQFPSLNLIQIIICLLSVVLAIVISSLFITFIGLFSFYIEDSSPFYWVYSKFILVLGTLFPIEYFPGILGNILKYSPIYAVSYGPAKLFVDFSFEKCIPIIISQIIYLFIAYGLCSLIYKKGVKKLNVNGG